MLRCCAGICGAGSGNAPLRPPVQQGVTKPVLALNEPEILEASPDLLIERFRMQFGPPEADVPMALVTKDFRVNVQRLLVLVPSAGSPFGSWDTDLPAGRGASVPLLQWAEANNYAVALFSSASLEANAVDAWDKILSASPCRHVVVLVAARGALELVHNAMKPVHELLFARIHIVSMAWEGILPASSSQALASVLPLEPKPLRVHMRMVQSQWPTEWADLEPHMMRQRLFEALKAKEDLWQEQESNKYMSISSLKENDVPGLRRLGVDERVARLTRDRNTDELSRLIDKNEREKSTLSRTVDEDDEPGVD